MWRSRKRRALGVVVVALAAISVGASPAGAGARAAEPSLAELNDAKAALDATALAAGADASTEVAAWYVDAARDAVVVEAGDDAAAEAFLAEAGVASEVVEIDTTAAAPRPLADVIVGGAAYYGETKLCATGFTVTHNGEPAMTTAGHCAREGFYAYAQSLVPMGTFEGSVYPGADMAWISPDAADAEPQPYIDAHGLGSGPYGWMPVAGSAEAPVGAPVCLSSRPSAYHCGLIERVDVSVTYPEGTVTGLTQTSVCAEEGDSGAGFLSGNQAQGVLSGGTGDCSTGGHSYFQPLNPLLSEFDLDLVTTGDAPDLPTTPSGCAAYQSVYPQKLTPGGSDLAPSRFFDDADSYFFAPAGAHTACLSGPASADFDLQLQWRPRTSGSWTTVAKSAGPGSEESISHQGQEGYYRYLVQGLSGSGNYVLGYDQP